IMSSSTIADQLRIESSLDHVFKKCCLIYRLASTANPTIVVAVDHRSGKLNVPSSGAVILILLSEKDTLAAPLPAQHRCKDAWPLVVPIGRVAETALDRKRYCRRRAARQQPGTAVQAGHQLYAVRALI